MEEVLVQVEGLSKKFCRSLKKSMWYGLQDIGNELLGRRHGVGDVLRTDEFWAVKDVSFEVKRGECLGLIGHNGAGKSTLLKILNGLIKPDRGRVTIRGRVGALIELGSGFNPILTGRENIYINGSVLGFSRKEIDEKFDSIAEFSEISDFLDTPVQNYSSGMKVRLGFAVASQMEPDVLLIDEVLAVGDVGFRAKCFNAISSLMQKTAVIFVTHAMPQVSRVCSDIMVMNHGKCVFQGKDIAAGIDHYYEYFPAEKMRVSGSGKAIIHSVELESKGERNVDKVGYLDDFIVRMASTIDANIKHPTISVVIVNQELQNVAQCSSYMNNFQYTNNGNVNSIAINFGKVNFNPGTYTIHIAITAENQGEVLAKYQNIKTFTVTGSYIGMAPIQISADWEVSS